MGPAPVRVDDTLAFLMGRWELTRDFCDHRSGARSVFSGSLVVAPLPPPPPASPDVPVPSMHVSVEEAGELRAGARAGPAHRRLRGTTITGGAALLWFPDGRPFVDLDLTVGEWRAVHDCGTDRYEIVTEVESERVVREHWHVAGPAKRYDATATFVRRAGGGRPETGVGVTFCP